MRAAVLMDHPVLFPGRCLFCGRSKGRMVDTMIDDEGFGRVYLCADVCLPTFAGLIGFGDLAEAHEAAAELKDRLAVCEGELVDARPILAAVAKASERYSIEGEPDEKVSRKRRAA